MGSSTAAGVGRMVRIKFLWWLPTDFSYGIKKSCSPCWDSGSALWIRKDIKFYISKGFWEEENAVCVASRHFCEKHKIAIYTRCYC